MIYFLSVLIILAALFMRPRPAHADPTVFLAPVLSSVIGGFFEEDAPSPPTAADMKTALQKALDPTLLKIAEGLNIDLGKMAMNEYNKRSLVRQRDQLHNIISHVNASRKELGKYNDAQLADFNKAYDLMKEKGFKPSSGNIYTTAYEIVKFLEGADPELAKRISVTINNNENEWANIMSNISRYRDYQQKYGDIIDKLPVEGITDMTDPEQIKAALKDVDLVAAIEKGASGADKVPAPSVKMTDEENALLAKAYEMVKNNPNIKTVDEAINIMKQSITGADEQSQKTIATLNAMSDKFANYKQSQDQTDLMNVIKDRTKFKWSGDYLNKLIASQIDPLNRQFADKSAAINEMYAAKGFGNSTGVITEGLVPLAKEYAGIQGDIINKSAVQAEEMANQIINDAITQGISLTDSIEKNKLGAWANAADISLAAGNLGLQTNTFKANTANDIAGLGTTRQALETSAMDVANKLNQQKQNLELTNIGLEAAARAENRKLAQDKINNILAIYGSQTPQANNLADSAIMSYQNAYADTVKHNTDLATGISNVVTGITNRQKTQTQPIQGGFAGAVAGANAGKGNTYKARTNNLYNIRS